MRGGNEEARPQSGAGTPATRTSSHDVLDQTNTKLCSGLHSSSSLNTLSRQVAWWPVHEFITAMVANANDLPVAGTPSWCALPDSDPRKLLALAVAGEHHVLRTEVGQEHLADAGKKIAASADWSALAQRIQSGRGQAYIPRKAS
ncbi:DUF2742 domain-containing protein [Mycolicibacterium wolinskyi]|uniref:DUF2742 domain-containing protein n=1 Tax=Mycolicibacterium wolinskyi TaxID=59750 RepID=UPI00391795AC